MTLPAIDNPCWFIGSDMNRAKGIVAAHISYRGESLIVIDVGDEAEMEIIVRPASLVAASEDAPIGFSDSNEDLHAAVADIWLASRINA